MTDQSAQLQSLEQALQEAGITYAIEGAEMNVKTEHSGLGMVHDTELTSTTIEVEIYDTGEV
jgi:hypothetical protein